MKQIYAFLLCLSGVVVVPLAGVASAEGPSAATKVSERPGIHQAWLERNQFIYKIGDIGGIEDLRDAFSGRSRQHPSYNRLDQIPENEGNDDSNMSNGMGNPMMTPPADVPDSVHGHSRQPDVFPGVRPEGDPSVRDLHGSGLSEPSGLPGSLRQP